MNTLQIPLSGKRGSGLFVLVDAADAWLANYRWWLSSDGYATTTASGKTTRMHQLQVPNAVRADHINLNKLDNRRANLRPATMSQNAANVGPRLRNKCGYKGVWFVKAKSKWRAQLQFMGQKISLGSHATAEDAARAYNAKARELFGAYALLNEVPA